LRRTGRSMVWHTRSEVLFVRKGNARPSTDTKCTNNGTFGGASISECWMLPIRSYHLMHGEHILCHFSQLWPYHTTLLRVLFWCYYISLQKLFPGLHLFRYTYVTDYFTFLTRRIYCVIADLRTIFYKSFTNTNCALLAYWAANSHNLLPTFCDNLSTPNRLKSS
jgi:hypothetical protein